MRLGHATGVATTLLILAAVCEPSSAAQWKSMSPGEYESTIQVTVDGKALTYYRFSQDTPLTFSVGGPTRMKLLVRLRLPMSAEEGTCTFDVYRDGEVAQSETLSSYPSKRAYYVSLEDFRPAIIRRIYIDVPTGPHTYEVRPRARCGAEARVFRSTEGDPSRVSIAPIEYADVETFLHRDKRLTYYLGTKDQRVVLEVVGPTSIKVNTRLLYDHTMSNIQTYFFGASRDDGEEELYKVETVRSEIVAFRDRDDLTPGALRHFMLEVPAGLHTYEFRVADALGPAVAFNFYIPRGDLLNEP